MKKKNNIINVGIIAICIALILGIISIGSVSGDIGNKFAPLFMNEKEAKNVGMKLDYMSDAFDRSPHARYTDDRRSDDYLTLHHEITLHGASPKSYETISLKHMTDACIYDCTYPRCEKQQSLGEDD